MKLLGVPCIACFCLLQTALAQQTQKDPESFPVPAGGALWRHKETGFALPSELGALKMEVGRIYSEAKWGVSLRYVSEELRARADVYIYPCPRPHGDIEQIRSALVEEASAALGELEVLRERGRYADIQEEEASVGTLELHKNAETGWLTMPIHLTINEESGGGVTPTPVHSLLVLTLYRSHWIKVRYTFPAGQGEDKGQEACDAFADEIRKCVLSCDMEDDVREWIAGYRKDPGDAASIDQGTKVIAFADAAPLVHLVIGESIATFGNACEKQIPDAMGMVLRAYIVGATDATLKGGTKAEMVKAAVAEVAVLCKAWEKKYPTFQPPSLSELEKAALRENKAEPPASKKKGKAKEKIGGKGAAIDMLHRLVSLPFA